MAGLWAASSRWFRLRLNRGAFLVAVACTLPAPPASAAEFAPDAHTLFLAHFNQPSGHADYALGQSLFCGNGAGLVDGYYGRAIDLRPRALYPAFTTTCSDYTPRFDGWGFHARGNVDPAQGTFECWFQPQDFKRPKQAWPGGVFLNADLQRAVPHPDRSKNLYASFSIVLNTLGINYCLPTVAGGCFLGDVAFRTLPGFARALDPQHWHHFALTWSQGEIVFWLDGRALASFDMTGQLGLLLLDNPVRYLSMSNCVLDELRISNVVRYASDFEPGWRDGKRPDYAVSTSKKIARYPAKLLPQVVPKANPLPAAACVAEERLGRFPLRLDRNSGALLAWGHAKAASISSEGLVLHEGLGRCPLTVKRVLGYQRRGDALEFVQQFDGGIEACHELRPSGNDALSWHVTLTNRGTKEAWLEALLGVALSPMKITEVFDGLEARRTIGLARHRDEYCLVLPFVAASGDGGFAGVGIDPRTDLSDLVCQWVPHPAGGILRQGTKVALAPGESFAIPYRLVAGTGCFDTLDALAAYHACFPDLYRLRPDVPIYSYLPATQDGQSDETSVNLKRVGYAGGFWGHGPGHDKGDEFGHPAWWDNPEFYGRREYEGYTRRIERLWQTIAVLRECITGYYQQSFDNWYPVRRFHTCPDLTPEYIVQSLWPGYKPNEDPLCFGQYYVPITNWWIVNEMNTPIGAFFQETTRQYHRQAAGACVGFINDMSHAGALYRHNDPIAQRTPGRSFSRDLGTFVRKALGRKQRYEVLDRFVDDGHRASFWSDGGAFSYTLCAYSAAIAIEGGAMYKDLSGSGNYVVPARHLLGEKPLTAMTHMNDDWTGVYLRPDEFTPATLRDYYRYGDAQLALFCLRHGVTLDPSSYMWGRQVAQELAPLVVESTVLGRKVVPAARVAKPLWICRAGDGLGSLLAVGNTQPAGQETDVEVVNRYFSAAPLWVPASGGVLRHTIDAGSTRLLDVKVAPRDAVAFKAVGLLTTSGPTKATARFSGDGLRLLLDMELALPRGDELVLTDFGPLYALEELTIDGRRAAFQPVVSASACPLATSVPGCHPTTPIPLSGPTHRISAIYRNRALDFTAAQWQAVDLIKDGRTNFCIVADAGIEYSLGEGSAAKKFLLGFERGTAAMLNDFLAQYDDEDGVPGNLEPAVLVGEPPADYPGWTVRLREDLAAGPGRVRIDADQRKIIVAGGSQGEIRRAMVVLLRLVDRKYPHVGRFFPLRRSRTRYEPGKPVPFEKWVERKQTRQFYAQFSDALFLAKPILRDQYESLYANGNMDFAGRYALRAPCYLFEPTYGDDYVYGYRGSGKATSREELQRKAKER